MKYYIIKFSENGGEYTGTLTVSCNSLARVNDERTIKLDDVTITIDEPIDNIEEIREDEYEHIRNECL